MTEGLAEPSAFVVRSLRLVADAVGPGARVLDVAMGAGRHAALLARSGLKVFGVDRDHSRLRQATRCLAAEGMHAASGSPTSKSPVCHRLVSIWSSVRVTYSGACGRRSDTPCARRVSSCTRPSPSTSDATNGDLDRPTIYCAPGESCARNFEAGRSGAMKRATAPQPRRACWRAGPRAVGADMIRPCPPR